MELPSEATPTAPGSFLEEIELAIARGSAERRADMARLITDLFLAESERYSDEEIALFDDVLARLTAEIEVSARALLARRLAPLTNAPPNVIRMLALDEADVACPVLAQSERLDDTTLLRCAKTKGNEHLLAIAGRRWLSQAITDVLVERGDRQVALTTAKNPGANISPSGFAALVSRSRDDDGLAEAVGARAEIPPHLFLRLLATASKAVQIRLQAEHPHAGREVQQVVAAVASRLQFEARVRSQSYAAAQAAVDALHGTGQLSESRVTGFAKTGRFEETTVALARLSDLPIEVIERAMIHDRPETILIIAKAAEISWLGAKSILCLRATKCGISISEMEQCLASFERLKPSTAKQIVRFYRKRRPH